MERLQQYYEYALSAKPSHPIDLDAAQYICDLINERYIYRMLEVGSGIGFSANYFALNTHMTSITSIEKEFGFFMECKKRKLSDKIEFIWKNFNDFESISKYPLIFLDAAKSKQEELFLKAEKLLKSRGLIIVDNIFLKRLQNRNDSDAIKLIEKNEKFKDFLLNLENFNVEIVDVGDGLAICQKKE